MTEKHPNVAVLERLNLVDLAASADLFSDDFVWHYFNPRLPDLQGDYRGRSGLRSFFERLGSTTEGTFRIEPISITPFGDELVVTHVRDRLLLEDSPISVDAVVVWRIVGGRIAEGWDIPAVNTARRDRL